VIDALGFEGPKTKQITALLARLGVAEQKVLLLTDGAKPAVHLSARNLQNVHVMPYADASTYQILWSDVVVVESAALERAAQTETPNGLSPNGVSPNATVEA